MSKNDSEFFHLDPAHTDPARVRKEREKAQQLKKSSWWKQKLAKGVCHYCEKRFAPAQLTMDHIVPIARGGTSTPGNVVPACKGCNQEKKLSTPVDQIFAQLEKEKPTADFADLKDSSSVWGDEQTRFFFDLTPDRVLSAVEASGLLCTGRCTALNSFENRVYEIELEDENESDPFARRRVVKFYRPGRWSREQILEEHEFLYDLLNNEVPVVAPLKFADGKSLHEVLPKALGNSSENPAGSGIFYAIFPKVGGRAPDELSDEQLLRIGRLLGRIHAVGASKAARHRIELTPETYGRRNLATLLEGEWIPFEFSSRYETVVREICGRADALFSRISQSAIQRIHGDCHLGNLLWNPAGPFFLDFDDMVRGPAVQDIWLLVPGRDEESVRQRNVLLEGYEEMAVFDRTSLRLIEPLRALRFVHYSAWLARRWSDPAFPKAFPQFGTHQYWQDETRDLEEQLRWIQGLT